MKILNVDDNEGACYVKSRILRRAGFTVLEAGNGAEALRLVAAEQPDLVLLDVELPDISGYEVCRRIKGNAATATIMVLQTSASFTEGRDKVRGLDEGADGYLTEPVQPEELIATVNALLRLRRVETELRQARDTLEARVQERTNELELVIKALRREITRRSESENALQTSQRSLQSTLDALSSHIAILDESGVILDVNASWRQFMAAQDVGGASHGRGQKFTELFRTIAHTDLPSLQAVIEGVRAVLRRQCNTFTCEYASHRHPEPEWFFMRVNHFDGANGARLVVVLENTTEFKRAEEALRRQQETLYQSEKLAAMGALLASVAHELNNPLAVVRMQLDLLAEEAQNSLLQERVMEVREATERCIRIVQSFLTLARRNPPQRTSVQLNSVVEASLQLLSHALHLDNVAVQHHLAADLPPIGADASQLQQVVVNLLLNAQQAFHEFQETSKARQVTLTTCYSPEQKRVHLKVADTGPGIPPQYQARIFEPFFTTKPTGVGTGLGLSVCRGIIEGHGGTISVVSTPGQGAEFCIELPVEADLLPKTAQPDAASVSASLVGTILIVDDEAGITRGLARLLRRDGHTVDTASNGRQALAMLHAHRYDLILCDLRMPELDGPSLYRVVAEHHPHLLARFIFLTGDTLGADARTFLEQTGVPRLVKPFSAAEGRRVVQQALATLT
jgi:two-component system NtrC family sensor kinase